MTTTPFVVLTSARTGSSWLLDTLGSHPHVRGWHELFIGHEQPSYGRDAPPNFEVFVAGLPTAARRLRVPCRIAYLQTVFAKRPGIRAAGFKIMYRQVLRNPGVLPYFAAKRVRAIHLVRANLLDSVISYEVAQATGVFHSRRGEDVPRATVTLNAPELRDRLEHMEWAIARGRGWLERYRLPRIDIAYEELVARRDETLERMLRFLGVDSDVGALDSPMMRTGGARPLEAVENEAEVRAVLAGTRYEWMLDGARP